MNVICLIGRAGVSPELKTTPNGASVVNFNLAVKKRESTIWVRTVAWNKTAELISKYVKKGDQVGITGSLDVREYEKDGEKRQVYEVVINQIDFLGSKKSEPEQEIEITDIGDDLPF